ncbi:unannotated protein [freshwater metagenome]|uniref:Unannotated protein n=1 Tax=freshwater metagenome TaxID=449393 RepID=A0A6J7HCQ7_9ZZZZ
MPKVIPPTVETDDEYFWDGVQNDQLLIQTCADCGRFRHPPVPMCGDCHSTAWTATPSQGTGTVHSWIVSRHPTEPDADPRVVILVELDDGIRFVSNLVDVELVDVHNEMRVELCFRVIDDVKLPQFRPAPSPSRQTPSVQG